MKTSFKDKAPFVCVRGPIFLFRVNPLPIQCIVVFIGLSLVYYFLGKNRHHMALFVRNCKLVLLLRREYQQGEENVFRPAEWRWKLPQVSIVFKLNICTSYEICGFFGTFMPENRIAFGKSLIAKLLRKCCFLNCLHDRV